MQQPNKSAEATKSLRRSAEETGEGPVKFSHLDQSGNAQMVDVASKPITLRRATVSACCQMNPATAVAIQQDQLAKGNVLQVARVAGIMAAKRTDELIPLCHSLSLDAVDVEFKWLSDSTLQIMVTAQSTTRTGVEMEAMVGATVAALTVYDMCKAIDRTMQITSVQLESKSGGQSGEFCRNP
jgi:cyclic pyranopterin monophosphate synthase